MRRAAAVGLFLACMATAVPPAVAQVPEAVTYQPPVDGAVVDGFRPPPTPYGPGNRGVDYATAPSEPVRAAAAGVVAFAGRVGLGRHVVVLHPDGIRTSYSFLASVGVGRGQRVVAGQPVGTSGASLHFGARAGEAYLDPLVLLAGGAPAEVRLVPDHERTLGSEAEERHGLRRFLGRLTGAATGVGRTAISWARHVPGTPLSAPPSPAQLQALARAAGALAWPTPFEIGLTIGKAWAGQRGCTPPGVVPPPPAGRRRLVLVAGLGSTSEGASVDDVDSTALGYAAADVVRFSYRGGTTADHPYDADDTQVDIRASGRRLRELLEALHAAEPGVPIDVIAHSQGGLVARAALGARAPPGVASLLTLATPHHGADLATAMALIGQSPKGALAKAAVGASDLTGIDPTSTSVGQLAETSDLVADLGSSPLPAGVRVTSIAAWGDVVVPSPRSRLDGAANVVVDVPGLNHHSDLPGSPAAQRELALALAGRAPTCQSPPAIAAGVLAGETISVAEDATGVALTALLR
ncbi:MAG: peptidoglycan DD-metalloendopeptidase family protein [Acidimicrobiales bacterium]